MLNSYRTLLPPSQELSSSLTPWQQISPRFATLCPTPTCWSRDGPLCNDVSILYPYLCQILSSGVLMTDKIFVTARLGVAGYCYPGLTLPPKAQISTFSQLFSGGDGILHRIETRKGTKMYQYWFTDGQSVLKSNITPQDPVLNRVGYVCRAYGMVPLSFTVESPEEYLTNLFS